MSVYKEIATEYKTAQSLVKALQDLGLTAQTSVDLRQNTLEIVSGYHSDNKLQAAISVERSQIGHKIGEHVWGGVGFSWNGKTYDLIADNLDTQHSHGLNKLLGEIKQRYTYHEIKRQAFVKGYTVQETKAPDGTIRLQLRSLK